ncbi:MAG: hypothetical protein SFU99_21595 [Saprospiraceae bacterium]|nr:hypothetical protein [Saprospiraceae bacterium]
MERKFFTLVALFFFGISFGASAQTSSVKTEANFIQLISTPKTQTASSSNHDWTLFVDEENKLYYIDFETLKVNLSDIVVKNQMGEEVFKDKVFNLPVDTIYELDFSTYKAGNYEIELRSFTGIIRKTISIK